MPTQPRKAVPKAVTVTPPDFTPPIEDFTFVVDGEVQRLGAEPLDASERTELEELRAYRAKYDAAPVYHLDGPEVATRLLTRTPDLLCPVHYPSGWPGVDQMERNENMRRRAFREVTDDDPIRDPVHYQSVSCEHGSWMRDGSATWHEASTMIMDNAGEMSFVYAGPAQQPELNVSGPVDSDPDDLFT
jgi:hypothetical protein